MNKIFVGIAALMALSGSSALAADLPVAPPIYKAPAMVAPPPCLWCGWYVGLNLGGAWDAGTASAGFFRQPGDRGFFRRRRVFPARFRQNRVASWAAASLAITGRSVRSLCWAPKLRYPGQRLQRQRDVCVGPGRLRSVRHDHRAAQQLVWHGSGPRRIFGDTDTISAVRHGRPRLWPDRSRRNGGGFHRIHPGDVCRQHDLRGNGATSRGRLDRRRRSRVDVLSALERQRRDVYMDLGRQSVTAA